jgi:hypothetical protein
MGRGELKIEKVKMENGSTERSQEKRNSRERLGEWYDQHGRTPCFWQDIERKRVKRGFASVENARVIKNLAC